MKKDSIHIKYLMTNDRDIQWGLTVDAVGFQHVEPGETYPPHHHPARYLFKADKGRVLNEYQLLYITRGKGTFISEHSGEHVLSEGNMFLLFPGEWHSYTPDLATGWDEYWIGFSGKTMDERIGTDFFTKIQPILHVGLRNEFVNMYLQAITVAQQQTVGFQQHLAGIVEYLLGAAYTADKSSSCEEIRVIKLISKAKLIMLENLNTNICPEKIADQLHISYSWFRRLFKQYTGFSPMHYMVEMKIQKSRELLSHTDMSNMEIAYALGFDNPNYFCTLFKNKTKISPMKYRSLTQGRHLVNA